MKKSTKLFTLFIASVTLAGFGIEITETTGSNTLTVVQARSRRKARKHIVHKKNRRRRHIVRKHKRRNKVTRRKHRNTKKAVKLVHWVKGIGGVAGFGNDRYVFQKEAYYCNGVKMTLPINYDYYGFSKGDTQVLMTTITNNSKHSINIGDFIHKHTKIVCDDNRKRIIPVKDNLTSPYKWRNNEPAYMNKFNTTLRPGQSTKVAFGADNIDMFDDEAKSWICNFYDNHGRLLTSPTVIATYDTTYES